MAGCTGFTGKNAYALFGVESTFNVAVATTKDIGIITSITPDANNNIQEVRTIGNRQAQDLQAGNFDETIAMDGVLNSGAIFELMFSTQSVVNTSLDYKHVFIDRGTYELIDCASSFTMRENYSGPSNIVFVHSGCKFNTLGLSVEQGGLLEFTSEFLGSSVETGTTVGTEVTTSTKSLSGFNCTLSTGTAGSETTVGRVRTFELNFNQSLDANDSKALGSRINQDLMEKNLETTGTFTITFTSTTEYERFLGGTSTSSSTPNDIGLVFSANNGVTLGSGRIELYVKLLGCQYESVSRTTTQDGAVEETFTYRATEVDDLYFVDSVSAYF